jgi:predicted PurR-regulated permease PerM
MTDEPSGTSFQLTEREHRWLTSMLILGTVAVAFVVIYFVTGLIAYFGDVIMVFFLAWLLAFILHPLASGLLRLVPQLPKVLAVIIVYTLLIIAVLGAVVLVTQQLYNSISALLSNWPSGTAASDQHLRDLLAPYQSWLNGIGAGQISLFDQIKLLLDNLKHGATNLTQPLGDLAFASLGIMGNLMFVFFLSLYISMDHDRIVSFLFRLVPPNYKDEARLLEHSVARSFGGFLRGQATMGMLYGLISMATSLLFGLPYMPVTAVASGVLQAIPFFGPFISWIPPVAVAAFFVPEALIPTMVIMIAGWFVVMNIVQPRLMAEAVGLHPVVVLGSVMIGSKLAGIPGAIFAIPVAAVFSAFFFYYLRTHRAEAEPVAVRAARRIEEREGRPVRVPRLPQAGEDQDLEGVELEPRPPVEPTPAPGKGKRPPTPTATQAGPEGSAPQA